MQFGALVDDASLSLQFILINRFFISTACISELNRYKAQINTLSAMTAVPIVAVLIVNKYMAEPVGYGKPESSAGQGEEDKRVPMGIFGRNTGKISYIVVSGMWVFTIKSPVIDLFLDSQPRTLQRLVKTTMESIHAASLKSTSTGINRIRSLFFDRSIENHQSPGSIEERTAPAQIALAMAQCVDAESKIVALVE